MRDDVGRRSVPGDGLTPTHNRFITAALEAPLSDDMRASRANVSPERRRLIMLSNHEAPQRGRRVREFVCSYRPLRNDEGQAVQLPSVS